MDDLLIKLSNCVEVGKIDRNSPYPPDPQGAVNYLNQMVT